MNLTMLEQREGRWLPEGNLKERAGGGMLLIGVSGDVGRDVTILFIKSLTTHHV